MTVDAHVLEVENLEGGYGPIQVLHGLSFYVGLGEVVVILGANGAGKTRKRMNRPQATHL